MNPTAMTWAAIRALRSGRICCRGSANLPRFSRMGGGIGERERGHDDDGVGTKIYRAELQTLRPADTSADNCTEVRQAPHLPHISMRPVPSGGVGRRSMTRRTFAKPDEFASVVVQSESQ